MSKESRKVYDKVNPSSDGRKFIPLSTNAMHYVDHPKMRPNMLILYAIIVDRYNVDKGIAYPSLERLAVDCGVRYNATSEQVEIVKEVGLIDSPQKRRCDPPDPLVAAA